MPPPLPSPPQASATAVSQTRAANGSRPSTAVGKSASSTSSTTPKPTPSSNEATSGGSRSVRTRRSSSVLQKENGGRRGTGGSSAAGPTPLEKRERTAFSRDGTARRNAKEVEGLKDYQLGHCLGRGAFGSVYCALNWSTGETVAIKQVRLSDMPRTELNVIMQEIDLLKNLHHPNIVKYHGFVKSADSLYIILEYCEQGSLHSICKNFGKFPENLVALYTAQVLQGLLFLHEQGVIHRDIKGANILTTKEGLVKLADFGVATRQQGLAEGSVVGTPYWMAPEVIELSGATTASDIWSLGCTVIELLDGKPPYHKFAPMPALFRIVNDDHPPLPEGASPIVRDFLMQCFQKDPNLRVSAKKLLKHPWIASAKKADARKPTEYDAAVKSVQQWNEALKASPPPSQSGTLAARKPAARAAPRPASRGTTESTKGASGSRRGSAPTAKTPFQSSHRRSQTTESSQTSGDEEPTEDVWDADFEAITTTMSDLRIPDHRKPHDNFAGLFSSEKLKQYANCDTILELDGKVDEWDDEFDGDLTVRSPLELVKGDPMETFQSFTLAQSDIDEARHRPPSSRAKRGPSPERHTRKASKDSQPQTQILRPASKHPSGPKSKTAASATPKKHAPLLTSHKDKFREDVEEDYSDLVPNDEAAFRKKLAGFSPNRPFNSKALREIQSKVGGSLRRRRTQTPTAQLVHDAAAMRRTRSSLEIQKYAENDDDDEDFTDLVFDDDDAIPSHGSENHRHSGGSAWGHRVRSPSSATGSESTASSERGGGGGGGLMGAGGSTLRLASSFTSDAGDDDEADDDDEDPFAALEEELDEIDLESNVARDKHARLCTLVEGLVSDLKLGQPEDVLAEIVDQLLGILSESPDVKSTIMSSHGMLPILEILEAATRSHIIVRLLRVVNAIISDDIEVQENVCFVGGIPIVTKFAHKKYSSDIRREAAAFVRMMYQTPTLTLQMFVSCGGLNVLVEFLEEDYDSEAGRDLVLVGVNGIWSVFELQGPTPKNDFCRIFSRSSVLYPLSLVLNRVLDEDGPAAEIIQGRIVNIFLLFSQAENHVKESVADRMVLKRVLKDLGRMSPPHQITMLKFIKNLSMLATTLDALQNSNAIEVLTDLLGASMKLPHFREISNQVLNTMYNLCRLSKARQEDAALSGIIPLLQRIVQTERPLKEFALPILCDMAHSGKVGRKILWQNKGLQFYVSLLADQYWAVTALDAIFVWLQEETAKVEEHLLAPPPSSSSSSSSHSLHPLSGTSSAANTPSTSSSPSLSTGALPGSGSGSGSRSDSFPPARPFADAIVQCFTDSKADAFEHLLEPLQKLLRLSPPIAASLAHRTLFERSAVKLAHAKKALVRLNLLRVIRSICDACTALPAAEHPAVLLRRHGLLARVDALARSDPAILVREMASELVRSSGASTTAGTGIVALGHGSGGNNVNGTGSSGLGGGGPTGSATHAAHLRRGSTRVGTPGLGSGISSSSAATSSSSSSPILSLGTLPSSSSSTALRDLGSFSTATGGVLVPTPASSTAVSTTTAMGSTLSSSPAWTDGRRRGYLDFAGGRGLPSASSGSGLRRPGSGLGMHAVPASTSPPDPVASSSSIASSASSVSSSSGVSGANGVNGGGNSLLGAHVSSVTTTTTSSTNPTPVSGSASPYTTTATTGSNISSSHTRTSSPQQFSLSAKRSNLPGTRFPARPGHAARAHSRLSLAAPVASTSTSARTDLHAPPSAGTRSATAAAASGAAGVASPGSGAGTGAGMGPGNGLGTGQRRRRQTSGAEIWR